MSGLKMDFFFNYYYFCLVVEIMSQITYTILLKCGTLAVFWSARRTCFNDLI